MDIKMIGPRANLQGAELQGAELQGADLQGVNLKGTILIEADLKLDQVLPTVNITGLPKLLLEHSESMQYDQSSWGYEDCATPCCLAARAGHFLGTHDPGHGILAIREAMPNFDLSVLYQRDPSVVIQELKRCMGASRAA